MYYELILNQRNRAKLTLAHSTANELFLKYVTQFKSLNPQVELEEILKVKTTIKLVIKLRKLLISFDNENKIQIEKFDFHEYQLNYLGLDKNIDTLFNSFSKRSSKNEIDDYSYRVDAMLNAHDLHKENLPPLNPNLKLHENLQPEPKKLALKL